MQRHVTYVGIVNRNLFNNLKKLLDLVVLDGVNGIESNLENERSTSVAAV